MSNTLEIGSKTDVLRFNVTQRVLGTLGFKPLLCHTRIEETRALCCSSPEGCEAGEVFECKGCKRLMPYCWGGADSYEEYCDVCAVKIMREAGE